MPSLKELVNNLPNFKYYGGVGSFSIEKPYGSDNPFGGNSGQPYVKRKIGERWSMSSGDNVLFRFGVMNAATRTVADAERIFKFFKDPVRGPQFIAKQVLLQLQNVQLEPKKTNPLSAGSPLGAAVLNIVNDVTDVKSIGPTRIYNLGVNTLAQVAGSAFGSHFERHGLLPIMKEEDKYQNVVKVNSNNGQNRLILLLNKFTIKKNENEPVLRSYVSGPGSVLGGGLTKIRKSTEFLTGMPVNSMKSGSIGAYYYGNQYGSINNIKILSNKDDKNRLIRFFNSSSYYVLNGVSKNMDYSLDLSKNIKKSQNYDGTYVNTIAVKTAFNNFQPILVEDLNNPVIGYSTVETDNGLTASAKNFDFSKRDFREYKNIIYGNSSAVPYTNYEKWNMEDRIGVSRARKTSERIENKNYYNDLDATADKVNKIGLFYSTDIHLNKDFKQIDSLGKQITNKEIRDIIKFRFKSIDNDAPDKGIFMVFRAYLTDFSDQITSKWNPYTYVGRGENFYLYESFTNVITFGFMLAASSRMEMKPMYQKLNYLKSTLAPDYSSNNKMRGNLMQLTIGDYVKYQPGIITDLKITVEDDYNWEIAIDSVEGLNDVEQHELPQMLKCNVTFIPIYNFLPKKSANSPFIGIDDSFGRENEPGKRNNHWLVKDEILKKKK